MLAPIIKSKIYNRLSAITSNSLVANSIKKELDKKSDINYYDLAKMVKDQIKDNPPVMNMILGADNVVFFQKLKLEPCNQY